jgi:hypothetical protein
MREMTFAEIVMTLAFRYIYLETVASSAFFYQTSSRQDLDRYLVSEYSAALITFVSREFELFLSNWKVNHATSSPGHQQSNGKAEAAVKIVKTLMKKTVTVFHNAQNVSLEFLSFES